VSATGRVARAIVAASLVLAAVGCGGGDDDADDAAASATTTTEVDDDAGSTTTTVEDTTTTADDQTSTTSAVSGPTQPPTGPATPASTSDDPDFAVDRASGEGCSPGGEALPNGWWFGDLVGPVTQDQASFDLECFFLGDAAIAADLEDGGDGDVPNDVYIRNANPALRDVPVDGSATARCLAAEGGSSVQSCAIEDLAGGPVWIRVNDGRIDRILEQFFP
jgi:hypothetical protein